MWGCVSGMFQRKLGTLHSEVVGSTQKPWDQLCIYLVIASAVGGIQQQPTAIATYTVTDPRLLLCVDSNTQTPLIM